MMLAQDPQISSALRRFLEQGLAILNSYQSEFASAGCASRKCWKHPPGGGCWRTGSRLLRLQEGPGPHQAADESSAPSPEEPSRGEVNQRHHQLYREWLVRVNSFLGQVSTPGPRVRAPGNSQALVRRSSARSASRSWTVGFGESSASSKASAHKVWSGTARSGRRSLDRHHNSLTQRSFSATWRPRSGSALNTSFRARPRAGGPSASQLTSEGALRGASRHARTSGPGIRLHPATSLSTSTSPTTARSSLNP